jgi:predicted Zn-ribbon and HTH transcriptional regulator
MKRGPNNLVNPAKNQKKTLRCSGCGHVFRRAVCILPPKCPGCGSRKAAGDSRVRYQG